MLCRFFWFCLPGIDPNGNIGTQKDEQRHTEVGVEHQQQQIIASSLQVDRYRGRAPAAADHYQQPTGRQV